LAAVLYRSKHLYVAICYHVNIYEIAHVGNVNRWAVSTVHGPPLLIYLALSPPSRQVDSQGLPELTLFTKDPCPLCDTLKLELVPFMQRVRLKQVDIEAPENVRFKELYRYEIPVLFLEGQYLCMNRLDVATLERRLCALEH
jgi:hypothetical protein